MRCCCNCSFNKCLKEHKETLEKELTTIINNWIKEHSEISRLYINNKNSNSFIMNMIGISQKDEIEVSIKFDN